MVTLGSSEIGMVQRQTQIAEIDGISYTVYEDREFYKCDMPEWKIIDNHIRVGNIFYMIEGGVNG